MPMTDLTPAEAELALVAIEWAATDPEAQGVDLDLVLDLRRLMRRRLDDEGWNRAWRIAAQLVVRASARRRTGSVLAALAQGRPGVTPAAAPRRPSVYDEPIVLQAQRELEASPVCAR